MLLDVDRLYQKYKNKEHILIRAGNREVKANVIIQYNTFGQPASIILYGEADGDMGNTLESLKQELEDAKLKAGYKQINSRSNVVNFEQNNSYENNIDVSLFQKGTQYAKYGIKQAGERQPAVTASTDENTSPRFVSDFFYFEVGDTARKQAIRAEKLDF